MYYIWMQIFQLKRFPVWALKLEPKIFIFTIRFYIKNEHDVLAQFWFQSSSAQKNGCIF